MELAATEMLVLLVVGLTGWLWRLERHQARIRWAVTIAFLVGVTIAWIAAHPNGRGEPAMELICGGAVGLLVMMVSRLRHAGL